MDSLINKVLAEGNVFLVFVFFFYFLKISKGSEKKRIKLKRIMVQIFGDEN